MKKPDMNVDRATPPEGRKVKTPEAVAKRALRYDGDDATNYDSVLVGDITATAVRTLPTVVGFDPLHGDGVEDAQEDAQEYIKPCGITGVVRPKRKRVSIATGGITISIPVISVLDAGTGFVVVMPLDDESVTFEPAIGSTVTVTVDGVPKQGYYPGIAFNSGDTRVVAFVVEDSKNG